MTRSSRIALAASRPDLNGAGPDPKQHRVEPKGGSHALSGSQSHAIDKRLDPSTAIAMHWPGAPPFHSTRPRQASSSASSKSRPTTAGPDQQSPEPDQDRSGHIVDRSRTGRRGEADRSGKERIPERRYKNTVEVDFAHDLPPVRSDSRRIVHVLYNLLTNAAKLSHEWSPILVTSGRQDPYVAVSITDGGRGVSPDLLPHLFRNFSRIDGDGGNEGIGGIWAWAGHLQGKRRPTGAAYGRRAMDTGMAPGTRLRFQQSMRVTAIPKSSQILSPLLQQALRRSWDESW